MGAWAPWDYIISYIGITAIALFFMHLTHRRAMDKLQQVYDQGLADQKALIAALQSMVAILDGIVQRERK
jgi:hypothetical protein